MNFKENQSEQKLRGGYYTTEDLVDFLSRWVAGVNPDAVLEPSCGDGAFLSRVSTYMGDPTVTAIEVDTAEAKKAWEKAVNSGLSDVNVQASDFLGWALEAMESGRQFDAVVGNPPFIRYQYLPSLFQNRAESIFKALNCKFTKHTNAWVPFVMASFALLRPGGRLAMVVPAEIIHIMHAQSLRTYLGQNARRVVIVDPEEIWFSGTLQGAVLLLAEKRFGDDDQCEGLGIYSVKGREFLNYHPELVFKTPTAINGATVEGKWTRAFLQPQTRVLLDALTEANNIRRFHEVADVDVGIITGANKFFLVEDDTVREFGLQRWTHPMFGRSEHCPGVIYDDAQHQANVAKGNPTNFLWFNGELVLEDPSAQSYIEFGENQDLHTRYKCRVRKPWYLVPSVYATDVGMLKRAHETPRLILNKLRAYTTDTAYRITVKEGTSDQLVTRFVNPLTALCAELEGRYYGGGVLELVPSEIERLLIPYPPHQWGNVKNLDDMIRTLPADAVLERQGRIILGAVGLTDSDQNELMRGWRQLRDRRQRSSYRGASGKVTDHEQLF